MQKTQAIKAYYFFDEAGDPSILGRRGVNLVAMGNASKTFMVGYLETTNPKAIREALTNLHEKLRQDDYLASIPSMHSTNRFFHANKDCAEVRREVFGVLRSLDFRFYCIVARKDEALFRRKYNLSDKELYKDLVSKLLENRLHLFSDIDCYFSAMGNVVRQDTMQQAIDAAIAQFASKWKHENQSNIRVIIQKNSEEPLLQAADYLLWCVQRVFERGEERYYNYMKEKIALVHDVFDVRKYQGSGNYYTPKNPLETKKIDPV